MSDTSTNPPSVLEQVPAGGGQNKPSSGTYGESAALADLEAQLPGTGGPAGTQPGPVTPPPGSAPALPPRQSPMLPTSIAAPTRRPDEPGSTPLTAMAPLPTQPSEQRITMWRSLASDPNVSETTRMWAKAVLDALSR